MIYLHIPNYSFAFSWRLLEISGISFIKIAYYIFAKEIKYKKFSMNNKHSDGVLRHNFKTWLNETVCIQLLTIPLSSGLSNPDQ